MVLPTKKKMETQLIGLDHGLWNNIYV